MVNDERRAPILKGTRDIDFDIVLFHTHEAPGGSVVLSGTLIEGIGNRFSDLDVYVFCDEVPRYAEVRSVQHAFVHKPDMNFCKEDSDKVLMTMDYYEDSEIHIDVEYWTRVSVIDLVHRVNVRFENLQLHSDNNYGEFEISRFEHLLLHRCIVGQTISGEPVSSLGIDEVFSRRYSYTLYRTVANSYWRFKDIAGAIDSGDGYLACELARECLAKEMQAFNHLHGCTNLTRKWFMTYWTKYCQPIDVKLHNDALNLLFHGDPNNSEQYILEIFDVVDRITHHNRQISEITREFLSPSRSLELLDEESLKRQKTRGKAQDHEFCFRIRAYS